MTTAVIKTSSIRAKLLQVLSARPHLLILGASLVVYLALSMVISRVRPPWIDEGWIASAPANWARTGSFGTPGLEPTGSWLSSELTGINEYTYWNLPVGIAAQAIWFKIFGFDVVTMRLLSTLSGAVMLIAWFLVISKLSGSRLAGALTAAFLAIDYTFIWSSADGRMDMMCLAFGACGLAAYLTLRETKWSLALWLANCFLALGLFTHPNGVLAIFSFLVLLVYFDRSRLGWRDLPVLIPYLFLGVCWGCYILIRPDYFLAQFTANASSHGGTRWNLLIHPFKALFNELGRYVNHFGAQPLWTGPVPNYAMVIPLVYWITFMTSWLSSSIRRNRQYLLLLVLNSMVLGYMGFFEGTKSPFYLVFVLQFFAALLAVRLLHAFEHRSPERWSALILVSTIVLCQIGTLFFKIRENPIQSQYRPTVAFVQNRINAKADLSVIADSCFGWDLGVRRVRDDARLGYYTGVRPDLIIEDRYYREFWDEVFNQEEPDIALYIRDLLENRYRLVFKNGPFEVYERIEQP